jgi:hypothetical protein
MTITKNVVVGMAINYDVDHVKNFVLSFRKFNQTDDVVLFVNTNRSDQFNEFLKNNNIKTATFETYNVADTGMNNARFFKYLEYLSDVEYNHVLISDVRDLVFQSNPFENLPTEFLYLFEEDRGIRIGKCIYNAYWMNCAYDNTVLGELFWNPILCAGTILGSHVEIVKFLKIFKQELLDIKNHRYDMYRSVNIDQSILNYIAYKNTQDLKLEIKLNGDIVGTVGLTITRKEATDLITHTNDSVSINGFFPAIVHQYDRHEELVKFYSTKY